MIKAIILILIAATAAFFLSAIIQGIKQANSMNQEERQQFLHRYHQQREDKTRERQLQRQRNRPTEQQQQTRLLRNIFWLTFFTRRH